MRDITATELQRGAIALVGELSWMRMAREDRDIAISKVRRVLEAVRGEAWTAAGDRIRAAGDRGRAA